jgi:hypothetical protein
MELKIHNTCRPGINSEVALADPDGVALGWYHYYIYAGRRRIASIYYAPTFQGRRLIAVQNLMKLYP